MDFRTDVATRDLALVNGDLFLITEQLEAIAQHVGQRLKTFQTEWFLDETVGVPYYDVILVKNPDPGAIDSILKTTILKSPGVTQITSFRADLNEATRVLQVDFEGMSTDGPFKFEDALGD